MGLPPLFTPLSFTDWYNQMASWHIKGRMHPVILLAFICGLMPHIIYRTRGLNLESHIKYTLLALKIVTDKKRDMTLKIRKVGQWEKLKLFLRLIKLWGLEALSKAN